MFISLCPISDVKGHIGATEVLCALLQGISLAKPPGALHPSIVCDGSLS